MTRARDLAAFVSNADGDIKFDTDTLFIDSSANRVGIGRTDPAHPLDIQNDSASRHLRVFRNASGTSAIMVQNSDTGSGSSDGLQLSVISGGDAQVANLENTNLRFLTNSTERMRILAGGGLTFNGDTAAANALDDYEEGTWTPILAGSTSTSGQTYGQQHGTYTKIGDLVHVNGYCSVNSIGTVTGTYAYISGLPFSVKNNSGAYASVNFGYHSNLGQNVNSLHGYANVNTAFAYVTYQNGASLSSSYLSPAGWGSTPTVIFSITYVTS